MDFEEAISEAAKLIIFLNYKPPTQPIELLPKAPKT